ncbi:amino acid ABC transporter substrate-binding protein [Azospirillum sp. RWY-5-1]|uniref:Amino acid ABC transporter substrate-binding protein n=1 Tax=Azospirillum oleiclasticum TaxID=2735135 RepID=A0ABX2TKL2_9PROT|nr:amino acid ABC transporter substrate-binding protein [Azospirillum oleiclasticum]NYZ17632.1 amino acid ABC transporter substrate-binding protein [Azospirillum oleiclasticum]NYZ24900.1 amino acid ABC transporter substrate-binding protein [Azospirillum oleiclasticum]
MNGRMTRRGFGLLATAAAVSAAAGRGVAQAPAGEPIRIGFSMPLSGALAGNGRPALLAQQVWAEDINARGGLLGRSVKLVFYDDQSNGANVPGIYTKLLDVDKVDLVISSYGTALIAPAMPVIIRRGMAFVSLLGSSTNEMFKYGGTANISPVGRRMNVDFAKGFFEIARGLNPTPATLSIAGLDSDFSNRAMESARWQAREHGIRVVYDRAYPPSTVDFSPIVRAIRSAAPDLVFFASYPPDSVGLLKAAGELKLTAKMLGGGMVGPQVTAIKAQLGAQLNNLVCWDVYAPEPTMTFPGTAAFLDRYRAAAEAKGAETLGLYAPPLAYAQMQVLEQAVTRAGSLDQAAIGAALHREAFPTIIGELRFDQTGEWVEERNIYIQYQGVTGNDLAQFKQPGTQVILYPPQYRSGQLRPGFPAA